MATRWVVALALVHLCSPIVIEIEDDSTFDQTVVNGDWLLVFCAPWNGHCKQIEGMWDQIINSLEGRVNTAKIPPYNNPVVRKFQVSALPTLIIYQPDTGDRYLFEGDYTVEHIVGFSLQYSRAEDEPQVLDEEGNVEDPEAWRGVMAESHRATCPVPPYTKAPIVLWWGRTITDDEHRRVMKLEYCDIECFVTDIPGCWHDSNAVLFNISNHNSEWRPPSSAENPKRAPWVAVSTTAGDKGSQSVLAFSDVLASFNYTATTSTSSNFYLGDDTISVSPKHPFAFGKSLRTPVPLDKKSGLVLYIEEDNCGATESDRHSFVAEFSQHITVDIVGSCRSKTHAAKMKREERISLMAKYKFVLIVEESICDNVVTHSLHEAFIAGSVPVYLGAPNVRDYEPVHGLKSIVAAHDYHDAKRLVDHLHYLDREASLYTRYLEYRHFSNSLSYLPHSAEAGAHIREERLTEGRRNNPPYTPRGPPTRLDMLECFACHIGSEKANPPQTEKCYGTWYKFFGELRQRAELNAAKAKAAAAAKEGKAVPGDSVAPRPGHSADSTPPPASTGTQAAAPSPPLDIPPTPTPSGPPTTARSPEQQQQPLTEPQAGTVSHKGPLPEQPAAHTQENKISTEKGKHSDD